MSKVELKKGYTHFFKETPTDPEYPHGYQRVLINQTTFPKLLNMLERLDTEIACDVETTGLDMSKDGLVGLSVSAEDKRSFYLPFEHKVNPENNLPRECLSEFYERILKPREVLWYNYPFDGHVLDVEGYDIESLEIIDVMNVCWLTDTNWKEIGLKWMANHFLGWNMATYEEVTGGLIDFSYLSPETAVNYACDDALATRLLYRKIYPILEKSSGFIVKLDSKCCLPLIRAHQTEHCIDADVLSTVQSEIESQLPELESEIYQLCGRSFNIGSPAQVAAVLEDMGIDTGQRTKKGALKTGAALLEKIDHPVASLIVRYKAVSTWRNNYITPLKRILAKNQPVRFKYFGCGVPTGRFKAGKDINAPGYYTPINIQAVIKPGMGVKYAYPSDSPDSVLGWEFRDEPNDYPVEYPDQTLNIRRAFVAPEGFYYAKFDFKAQELRIPANMSREPIWVDAFQQGQDIHNLVCQEVFGELSSELRNLTKIINFSVLYGATAYSLSFRLGKTQDEVENFLTKYKSSLRTLFRWHDAVIRSAARTGCIYTAFGRPRRLAYWFSSSEGRVRSFARRSAINGTVQGSGADIFRIAFVNMYNKLFSQFPDDIKFRAVIHDEIDVIFKKTRTDMLDLAIETMQLKRKDWPVTMEIGVEVGTNWGNMVEFIKEGDVWKPKRK